MLRRCVFACLLLIPFTAYAATPGVWQPAGPDGGTVLALAVAPDDPDALYAGTQDGGVFKSVDAGESWFAMGLRERTVTALAVDPRQPDVIYAGVANQGLYQGLYQSRDGGSTWLRGTGPIDSGSVEQILIDPLRPANVYALFSQGLSRSVLRTRDGGRSWALASRGLPADVAALAIDPKHPDLLYAGTTDHGVYSSNDGAGHWRRRNRGTPPPSLTALAVDTVKTSRLYAGTVNRGVYLSLDGGVTWKKAPSSPPRSSIQVLVAQPGSLGVVWAGTIPNGPDALRGGVFRTQNGGKTWPQVAPGLIALEVRSLALSPGVPGTPRRAYAGVQARGVYRWTEGDAAWKLSREGLRPVSVNRIAADPSRSGHLLAGTGGFGVLATQDGGDNWTPVDSSVAFASVIDLEFDPSSPAAAYAGVRYRVDRSLDGGNHWQALIPGGPSFWGILAVDPSQAGHLYASMGLGIYRSHDFGATWTPSLTILNCLEVLDIEVAPGSGTVYAGGHLISGSCVPAHWLYRSKDGGETWQALVNYPRGFVLALAVDPATGILYAAQEGVFLSTDEGATWSATNAIGEGPAPYISALVAAPGVVYAGGFGHVWESRDTGHSWQEVGAALPERSLVLDLALDRDGVLWAATTYGAFRLER
jgi:photosystem II stability/assembly factor-like uncharacterized protein